MSSCNLPRSIYVPLPSITLFINNLYEKIIKWDVQILDSWKTPLSFLLQMKQDDDQQPLQLSSIMITMIYTFMAAATKAASDNGALSS